MIPSMEPPIISAESIPLVFDESDPEKMLMLDLLKEMYIGKEHPFLTSSRDGITYLIIPRTITRVFKDANAISADAPGSVRISARTGGSNGSGN